MKTYRRKMATMVHHRRIINLSTYLTEVMAMGLFFAVPVVFSTLLEMFRESRAKTTTISSVLFGLMGFSGVINGLLVQRVGPRTAGLMTGMVISFESMASFFLQSILYRVLLLAVSMGIGCSLFALSVSRILSYHFPGKPGQIALYVQTIASGIGRIVFTYVLTECLHKVGLQWTLFIMGAILLNCTIVWTLWETKQPLPLETVNKFCNPHTKSRGMRGKQNIFIQLFPVLTHNRFLPFFIGMAFLYVSQGGFIIMFADILKSRRFNKENVRLTFVILSICNVCGRISFGFLKQIPIISSLCLAFLLACMSAISFWTMQLAEEFWTIIIVCCVIGFGMGATVAVITVGTLKIIGPDYLPFGIGLIFTSVGVENVVVGSISGNIRDIIGTYTTFLRTSTLSASVSALLFLVAMTMKQQMRPNKAKLEIPEQGFTITTL